LVARIPAAIVRSVSIDFVIINALEDERDAVLAKLPGHRRLDSDGVDSLTYYEAVVPTIRSDGAEYRVIVTCLSRMGQLAAGAAAAQAVQRWRPRHVLMVGIAGGVAGEVEIGDVIVAREVIDTTHGKVVEDHAGIQKRAPRWRCHECNERLVSGAVALLAGWQDSVTVRRPSEGLPRRHVAQIFSGTDVVASKALLAEYRDTWPKAIGVEIEGAAVATFLSTHRDRPGFLMIRGVSDFADRDKSAPSTTMWRAYACDVAAAYMHALLRSGPIAAPLAAPIDSEEPSAPVGGEIAMARAPPATVDAGLSIAMPADAALTDEFSQELDHVRELLHSSRPREALRCADALAKRAWEKLTPRLKQRAQNYRGVANAVLNNHAEAARLLIDSLDYDCANESATCGAVTGYLLRGDRKRASQLARHIVQRSPDNASGYAVLADSAADDEPFDVLFARVPQRLRAHEAIVYSFGQLARRRGLHRQAIELLRSAAREMPGPDVQVALGAALIEAVLARGPGHDLNDDERKRLEEACAAFGTAVGVLSDGDATEALVGAFLSRATAFDLLGRSADARRDVDRALALAPQDSRATRQQAVLLVESGKRGEAIPILTELIARDTGAEIRVLLAQCYRSTGEPQLVREVLGALDIDDLSTELRLAVARLSADAALELGDQEAAECICSGALARDGSSLAAWVLAARIARLGGDADLATERIRRAETFADGALADDDQRQLADELFAREEWGQAAVHYAALANVGVDSPLTRRLIWCHERAGNIGRVLGFCRALREAHGPIESLTNAECAILEEIGDLPEATKVVEAALAAWPDDLELRIRQALIALRRGEDSVADSFLDGVAPPDLIDPRLGKQILQLLLVRGRKERAIELAYEARRASPNSERAHMNLVMVLFSTDAAKNTAEPERVAVDSAVRLRNAAGDSVWWLVEDRADADMGRRELRPTAPLARSMLARAPGDTVDPGDGQPLVIAEILSKFVYAFRESLSLFGAAMPEPPELKKMTLTSRADGSLDPQPILDIVEGASRRREKIVDFYVAGRLSIGACALMLRRSPIETIGALAADPRAGIRCAAGDVAEWTAAQSLLSSRPRLMADLVALLTLKALDLMQPISATFGRPLVAQTTIDAIRETIHERTGMMARGFGSVGHEGGRFVWTEIGADAVKRSVDELDALLAWTTEHTDVVACHPALKVPREWRMKQAATIGISFTDTALIAATPGLVLLTDDASFRAYATAAFGAAGVWCQPVLQSCVDRGAMSPGEYGAAVCKLSQLGQRHVMINERILLHAAARNDWMPSASFVAVARCLAGGQSDEDSAIQVASATLRLLWQAQVPSVRRDALAMSLLNELSQGRVGARVALVLIKTLFAQAGGAGPLVKDIARLIRAWYVSRIR
jgi:nucleoside phosphorylase/tetratricopeptide (TPR) repeat protein